MPRIDSTQKNATPFQVLNRIQNRNIELRRTVKDLESRIQDLIKTKNFESYQPIYHKPSCPLPCKPFQPVCPNFDETKEMIAREQVESESDPLVCPLPCKPFQPVCPNFKETDKMIKTEQDKHVKLKQKLARLTTNIAFLNQSLL